MNIVDLSNDERLRSVYDPNYIHYVAGTGSDCPVRVCMDGRMLADDAGTGVATYARTLARSLPGAGAEVLTLDDDRRADPRGRVPRLLSVIAGGPRMAVAAGSAAQWVARDIFREAQMFFTIYGRLLALAFDRPPAVMHWTYPIPLYAVGAKNLYTVHDLIPLTHPHLTPIPSERHGAMLRRIVAQADGIVTVSDSVRRAMIRHFGIAPDRVTNSYQAVDTPLQADPPLPSGLRSGRYFFFCGRVERRKNLECLARAHAESGSGCPLVIVGPDVAGEEALEATLRGFATVRRIAWVSRPELIGMMRRARALLFPSLAEGFGLPIAEAMTLGCPVLTSVGAATEEIAGGAALLVDPLDRAAIVAAIRRLDTDDALRGQLRAAGFRRGNAFTPELYIHRLRALYDRALSSAAIGEG